MTASESRIMAFLELAEVALSRADNACETAGIGPFRHRIHALALDLRRLHIDGFGEISKRKRTKQPHTPRRRR
jgi:hypothetical protein